MGRKETGVNDMDEMKTVIEHLDEQYSNWQVVIMALVEDILPDEIYEQITEMLAQMVCDEEHPLQFPHLRQMADSKNMSEIIMCMVQGLS